MKCSNPNCNRSIGLISCRRGWFGQGRYCSKRCRDSFAADQARPVTYFEWFLRQLIERTQRRLVPVRSRIQAR